MFRRDCTYGYFEQMDKPDQVGDLLKAGAITYYMHFGPEDWHILPFIWTCLDMQVPEQPLYCNPGKRLYSTRYLRRGTMITCLYDLEFSFWLFKDGEQERNLNWA